MPFEIVTGDITEQQVDAIVNAANSSLRGGGGVDGAIHRAAGPKLHEACLKLGRCPTGEARITPGFDLPAQFVIHTVGPIWTGGQRGEARLLASACRHSLELAAENGCVSVALPLISAGAYGYPGEEAQDILIEEINRFLESHEMLVRLVLFDKEELLIGNVRKLIRDRFLDGSYRGHEDEIEAWFREQGWRGRDPFEESSHSCTSMAPVEGAVPSPRLKRAARRKLPSDLKVQYSLDLSEMFPECRREVKVSRHALPEVHESVPQPCLQEAAEPMPTLEDFRKAKRETFSALLQRLIREHGLLDADCYKKANVDRRLFSKIRSNPDYQPSKATVMAFAVALELTREEADTLLASAGFMLSDAIFFDRLLDYCLRHHIYNVTKINLLLYTADQPLLGRG